MRTVSRWNSIEADDVKRRYAWIGAGITGALLVAVWLFRDLLLFGLMAWRLAPDVPFDAAHVPPPPDYQRDDVWAALPDRRDLADTLPATTVRDRQEVSAVDVFFVHPTTYYRADGWNQPLDHATTNAITDGYVLRGQASVFNSCCAIYAPRYRQATLYAFVDDTGSGQSALDLAYTDVVAAFDQFIAARSRNRPLVLAAHSQGSKHLVRLLRDRFSEGQLRERLVVAYAIGFAITPDDLPASLPVCATATQTGCIVTWNAVGPHPRHFGEVDGQICVNPLTWATDGERADFDLNLGAVSFGTLNVTEGDPTGPREPLVEPGAADAQCVDGRLRVSEIRSDAFDARLTGRDNYHIYDYALFHMNLRANAETRVRAYLRAYWL